MMMILYIRCVCTVEGFSQSAIGAFFSEFNLNFSLVFSCLQLFASGTGFNSNVEAQNTCYKPQEHLCYITNGDVTENPQRLHLTSTLPSVESPLPSWWGSQTQQPDGRPRWRSLRTPTARILWSETHQSEPTSGWLVLEDRRSDDRNLGWSCFKEKGY